MAQMPKGPQGQKRPADAFYYHDVVAGMEVFGVKLFDIWVEVVDGNRIERVPQNLKLNHYLELNCSHPFWHGNS